MCDPAGQSAPHPSGSVRTDSARPAPSIGGSDLHERVGSSELWETGDTESDQGSSGREEATPRSRFLIPGGTGNGPGARHFMQAEQVISAPAPFSFGQTQAPFAHFLGRFVSWRNTRSTPGGTSRSSSASTQRKHRRPT